MMQFGSPEFFEFLLGCSAIILGTCIIMIFGVRGLREEEKKKQEIASKTIRHFAGTGHGPTFVFSETSHILAELYPNFSYTTFSKTEECVLIPLSFLFEKGHSDRFFIRKEDLATLELIKRLSVK